MARQLKVPDALVAKDIAKRVANSMWKFPTEDNFYLIQLNKESNTWHVECKYFDETLIFEIDAVTGSVIEFKITKE